MSTHAVGPRCDTMLTSISFFFSRIVSNLLISLHSGCGSMYLENHWTENYVDQSELLAQQLQLWLAQATWHSRTNDKTANTIPALNKRILSFHLKFERGLMKGNWIKLRFPKSGHSVYSSAKVSHFFVDSKMPKLFDSACFWWNKLNFHS